MHLQFNCNYRCWECSRECQMKELFKLPDSIFYSIILDSFKPSAGMLITRGFSKKYVDFEFKKITVAFKISRELTLKSNSKN